MVTFDEISKQIEGLEIGFEIEIPLAEEGSLRSIQKTMRRCWLDWYEKKSQKALWSEVDLSEAEVLSKGLKGAILRIGRVA